MLRNRLHFALFLAALFTFSVKSAHAQLNCSFTINPLYSSAGCEPLLTVCFDPIIPQPAPCFNPSYNWIFEMPGPDVTITNNPAPCITWSVPGSYDVTLWIPACGGYPACTTVVQNMITVYAEPIVSFFPSDSLLCMPGASVTYTSTSTTTCPLGGIVSYYWDFGAGGTSTSPNPVVPYNAVNCYDAFLSVTDACNCTSNAVVYDVVCVVPAPTANFVPLGPTSSCTSPFIVCYDGSGSTGVGLSFNWTSAGGTIVSGQGTDNACFSFTVGGPYSVTLVVTDTAGCIATYTVNAAATVYNPAVAIFTYSGPTSGCPGFQVCYDGTPSTPDPGGTYFWTFEGGSPGNSTGPTPCVTYNIPGGPYDVTLVYTVGGVCSSTVVLPNLITVFNVPAPPTINQAPIMDCVLPQCQTYTITGGPYSTYDWTFPGGTPPNYSGAFPAGQFPPQVCYNSYGSWSVGLTVTNANGCSTTVNFPNMVVLGPPNSSFTVDSTMGCTPLTVTATSQFVGSVQTDWCITYPGGPANTYPIDTTICFPNAGDVFMQTYTDTGCYDILMIVENAAGCIDSSFVADAFCISNIPCADFYALDTLVCLTEPVEFVYDTLGIDTLGPNNCHTQAQNCNYWWNYGDGGWQNDGPNPMHMYNDTGCFDVALFVECNDCKSDTLIIEQYVCILPPVAQFTDSTSCANPYTYYFTNTSMLDNSDSTSSLWKWSIVDNAIPDTIYIDSTSWDFNYVFPTDGTYDINLYIIDTCLVGLTPDTCTVCEMGSTQTINICGGDSLSFTLPNDTFCTPATVVATPYTGCFTTWKWEKNNNGVYGNTNANPYSSNFTNTGIGTIELHGIVNGCTTDVTHTFVLCSLAATASATPTNVCTGVPVNFTGGATSVGGCTVQSWFWNFGDTWSTADTAITQNGTWSYSQPGTYIAALYVDNGFCIKTATVTITVVGPLACFNYFPTNPCPGQNVNFTNCTIGCAGLNFIWDFGDGTPPVSVTGCGSVNHVYNLPGTYNICLTASNPAGCQSTVCDSITVSGPIASFFGSPLTTTCPPLIVQFTSNSVGASSYAWDFGDSSPISTVQNPNHVYTTIDTFTVTLTVTSANGCQDDTTIVDYIMITGPIGTYTFSPHGYCSCTDVTYTITTINAECAIVDGVNGCVSPCIPFVNGVATYTFSGACSYCEYGLYYPSVYFIDAAGCTVNITAPDTILIDTPAVAFSYLVDICDSGFVTFTNETPSLILHDAEWDYGDGSPIVTLTNQDSGDVHQHYYDSSGTYTVTLVTKSGYDCADTMILTLYIPASPFAAFSATPDTTCTLDSILVTDLSVSIDPIATNQWLLDGTNITTGPIASIVLGTPGNHTICEIVTTIFGCTDTVCHQVFAYNLPPVVATDPGAICFGASIQLNVTGGSTYLWTPALYLDDPTLQNPTVILPLDTITYIVSGTDVQGCASFDTITLIVNINPIAGFTDSAACLTQIAQFTDTSVAGSAPIDQWSWTFQNGIPSTSIFQNPQASFNIPGPALVTLTVTDTNNCSGSTSVSLFIDSLPTSNFSTSNVCLNDSMFFTDLSISGTSSAVLTDWDWDFGDGTTLSGVQNPVHFYAVDSTYTVTLHVMNSNGCEDIDTQTVTVYQLPVAQFNPDSVCFGDTIQFIDLSIPGDTILSVWDWTFGDGNNSAQQNPQNYYDSCGTYTLKLTVIDANGCLDDSITTMLIACLPIAYFVNDTPCVGVPTQFTDLSIPGEFPIDSWNWVFDDGYFSTLQNPTHPFTPPAIYNVVLSITDSVLGCVVDTMIPVTVNPLPVVLAVPDTAICLGDQITLFGSGGIVYDWQPNVWLDDNTLQNPTATPLGDTTYILTATDIIGCSNTDTLTIQVNQLFPDFSHIEVCLNDTTQFTDLSTTINGFIVDYFWDFGVTGIFSDTSHLQNPGYVYPSPGLYTVSLQITDSIGCIQNTIINPVIVDTLPVALFTFPVACDQTPVLFTDLSSSAAGVISWTWDFGDGSTSDQQNPMHVFPASGSFTVTLAVIDSNGCSQIYLDTIFINPLPAVDFDAPDVCFGFPTVFTNLSSTTFISGWSFGDGVGISTQTDPTYTYTTSGPFNVTLIIIDSLGCTDTTTEVVTVNPLPVADFSLFDTLVCLNSPVSFTDNSTGTGISWVWDFGDAVGTSILQNPVYTYPSSGNYLVTLSVTDAFGCIDTDTLTVNIEEPSTPIVTPADTTICVGESVQLLALGGSTIFWSPPDYLSCTICPDPIATPLFSIIYTANVTNIACPFNTATSTITVIPDVAVNATATPTTILMNSFSVIDAQFIGPAGATVNYSWSPSADLDCATCQTTNARPIVTTTYTVQVDYALNGVTCTSIDTITITVVDVCDPGLIYIPNTFTPNFDNFNEIFYLRSTVIEEVHYFRVYNRWGELMFETDDQSVGWDGTLRGKQLNTGVYVYTAEVVCVNGDVVFLKGNITLLR